MINTVLMDLPATIPAFCRVNADLSYTIVINARLNREQQENAYLHELQHIRNGDYEKKCDVSIIEYYVHKGE